MTPELFMARKKKKLSERDAGLAALRAERAKNDSMRYILYVCFAQACILISSFYYLSC